MTTEAAELTIAERSASSVMGFSPGFTYTRSIAVGTIVTQLTMVTNRCSPAILAIVF